MLIASSPFAADDSSPHQGAVPEHEVAVPAPKFSRPGPLPGIMSRAATNVRGGAKPVGGTGGGTKTQGGVGGGVKTEGGAGGKAKTENGVGEVGAVPSLNMTKSEMLKEMRKQKDEHRKQIRYCIYGVFFHNMNIG